MEDQTFRYTKDQLWKNVTAQPNECTKGSNQLFVQYTCEIDESQMWFRYRAVTFMVWMGLLMALLFYVYVRFASNSSHIQALEFDLDTVTAQDYSIEFQINKEVYEAWKDQYFDPNGKEAPAMALKRHMQAKIENLLVKHNNAIQEHFNAE